ncbi:hypothetical protein DNTS_030216 [Danionella cerebrum]|uniref:Stereocilin n=1 Tax=Danionella cerebrum TaxID=2873325 RepID=A0A553Q8B0_9TELE|nr:hypothetical protein DNTS_030216 [Danionella translucida]
MDRRRFLLLSALCAVTATQTLSDQPRSDFLRPDTFNTTTEKQTTDQETESPASAVSTLFNPETNDAANTADYISTGNTRENTSMPSETEHSLQTESDMTNAAGFSSEPFISQTYAELEGTILFPNLTEATTSASTDHPSQSTGDFTKKKLTTNDAKAYTNNPNATPATEQVQTAPEETSEKWAALTKSTDASALTITGSAAQSVNDTTVTFPGSTITFEFTSEEPPTVTSMTSQVTAQGVLSIDDISGIFGTLQTLTPENAHDLEIVETWTCVKLIPILPFITPDFMYNMSKINFSCISYQTIVGGLNSAFTHMPVSRRQEITSVLVGFLGDSASACNKDVRNNSDWLILNFGQFFTFLAHSDLLRLNISWKSVIDSLNSEQKVELILTPELEDESSVREMFLSIIKSQSHLENFFTTFISIPTKRNISSISPIVSSIVLNMTLMMLEKSFSSFTPKTFALWFQTYLKGFLTGIGPDSFSGFPLSISCDSYSQIVKGCDGAFWSLTQKQTKIVYSFALDFLSHQVISGSSCVEKGNNNSDWILRNFGQFRILANFSDLIRLKRDFNGDVLAVDEFFTSTIHSSMFSCKGQSMGIFNGIFDLWYQLYVKVQPPALRRALDLFAEGQWSGSPSEGLTQTLLSAFVVECAALLTLPVLAQVCSTPSQLRGPGDVEAVMKTLETQQLPTFFDLLSQNIPLDYPPQLRKMFLRMVLERSDLWAPSVSDSEISLWLTRRLRPMLTALSSADVSQYFRIITGRGCELTLSAVRVLDSVRASMDGDTQHQIFSSIQQLLTAAPLRCYTGGSFLLFLKDYFLSFGFPDLKSFLELAPSDSRSQIVSTVSLSELSELIGAPQTLGDGSGLCELLKIYNQTRQYLEEVHLTLCVQAPLGPADLAQQILTCVWPKVLQLDTEWEVDLWFGRSLPRFLPLLSKSLINPEEMKNASCLSYRRIISVLGDSYNFSQTDFRAEDFYSSIKVYLSSDGSPRCFDTSDPQLNSTSWLLSYIGIFISFVSVTDLNSFVSSDKIGVFLENPENLELLNRITSIQPSVVDYYMTQLYLQNPSFNPVRVPGHFLCQIPSVAFTSRGEKDTLLLIQRVNAFCSGTKSLEISTALAGNFLSLSSSSLVFLGDQSVGLTEGQIFAASPTDLQGALSSLSSVPGWSQGQADAFVQTLAQANFSITTGSDLLSLGTLVKGVPSQAISNMESSELLTVSQSPSFLGNMLSAPLVLQFVFVQKIISVDERKVIENIPDALAGAIPTVLLVPQESTSVNLSLINQKQWKPEQAAVLFSSAASLSEDTEELAESLLQGFSCSSVQMMTATKVKKLVKACRRRAGRRKVQLHESQLICMYNYVKDDPSLNFTEVPSEVLLYYSSEKVSQVNCRSFFSAAGAADFSVLSSSLNKQNTLLSSARSCLGITGPGLTRDHLVVLGNLSCSLDPVSIRASDPWVIESLKNCADLSEGQITSVQELLLMGNTSYGNTSLWDQPTLESLVPLPLYFTDTFWQKFSPTLKRKFLKVFMPILRSANTEKPKLKNLFKRCNAALDAKSRVLRSTGKASSQQPLTSGLRVKENKSCVAGNITEVTIADASFPFGFTLDQFTACLEPKLLKENLAAAAAKVDDSDFQRVILDKLMQVYPSGLRDSVLKVLGSASRQATLQEISSWSITSLDTLAALMDRSNGAWDPEKSRQVILRYLNVPGNTLGVNELNTILSNLCSLNISTLRSITPAQLRNVDILDLSSCSSEQKSLLYSTANSSFRAERSNGPIYYQLIKSYLGGAPVEDIRALGSSNISLDISIFRSLSIPSLTALSVRDVRSLMGSSVSDLKVFENDSAVQVWLVAQPQSELDTLELGLRGGRVVAMSTTGYPSTLLNITSGGAGAGTSSSSGTSNATMLTNTTSQSATTATAHGKDTPTLITSRSSVTCTEGLSVSLSLSDGFGCSSSSLSICLLHRRPAPPRLASEGSVISERNGAL